MKKQFALNRRLSRVGGKHSMLSDPNSPLAETEGRQATNTAKASHQ